MAGQSTSISGRVSPSVDECQEQVRRVLGSSSFRNAATSQVLLQFVTSKTLAGSSEDLKEYTIGVEALGRRPDFDPKTDPIVRVQSHRLRLRLREYYAGEGSSDPVLIQLPKGHYATTFDQAVPSAHHFEDLAPTDAEALGDYPGEQLTTVDTHLPGGVERSEVEARGSWKRRVAGTAAVALLATGAFFYGEHHAESRFAAGIDVGTVSTAAREPVVEAFWSQIVGNDSAPVIAYTDAVFLLDDSNDLFRYRHGAIDSRGALVDPHLAHDFASNPAIVAQAGSLYYENGYTGTGELEAASMLAGLLGRMGLKPVVKSSRDISPGDLNDHNVILLGSPFQNEAVAQLLNRGDFEYQNPDQRHEQWRAQILNNQPRAGEARSYRTERDTTTQVLKADYSLITIAPGMIPGRTIAIIGGLDTKGTEGAMEFATSRFGVQKLNVLLGNTKKSDKEILPPFQALVRVNLAKGYQVIGTDLIAVHSLPLAKVETNSQASSH